MKRKVGRFEIDFDQKFDDDFRELFTKHLREHKGFGKELWSALANVNWHNKSDHDNTNCGHSFRSAGSLIASMLCHGDYMDAATAIHHFIRLSSMLSSIGL